MNVASIIKTNVPLSLLEENSLDVSIIIPVFGYRDTMGRAISSALSQRVDLEILLVDNGNADNTWEDMLWWRKQDSRIRPIKIERNVWLSGARNVAAWRAKGKYLSFLDPDDMYLPSFLEERVKFLDAHPEIVFTYGDAFLQEGSGGELTPLERGGYRALWQIGTNSVLCQSVVVRKWAFAGIGGNEEYWHFGEDWGAWARLHAVAPSAHDGRKVYAINMHGRNWQSVCDDKVPDIYDCNHLVAFHNGLCAGFSERPLSVLCALPNIVPNGAQRMALRVNQVLQAEGNKVDVVTLAEHHADDPDWVNSGLRPKHFRSSFELRDALGRATHDVALVHTWPGQDRSLQTHLAPPALVVHHSCDVEALRSLTGSPRLHAVVAHPKRVSVYCSDNRTAGSQPSLVHMPNMPDVSLPDIERKDKLAQKYGADPQRKWLLCLTRADAEKGCDILLRVLPSLMREFEVFVIGVAKGQQFHSKMEEEISAAGAHSLGMVPHQTVLSLMNACEVFLAVSRREANSIAIMEAAALGVPVVCSEGAAPHWGDGLDGIGCYADGDDEKLVSLCKTMAGHRDPFLPSECSEQSVMGRYRVLLRALALRGVWSLCMQFLHGKRRVALPDISVVPANEMAAPLSDWVAEDLKLGCSDPIAGASSELVVDDQGVAVYKEAGEVKGRIFFNPLLYGPSATKGDVLCLPPVVSRQLPKGDMSLSLLSDPVRGVPCGKIDSILPLDHLAFSARIFVDSYSEILYALSVGVVPVVAENSHGLFVGDYDGVIAQNREGMAEAARNREGLFWKERAEEAILYWQKLYAPNGRVARAIAHLRETN